MFLQERVKVKAKKEVKNQSYLKDMKSKQTGRNQSTLLKSLTWMQTFFVVYLDMVMRNHRKFN